MSNVPPPYPPPTNVGQPPPPAKKKKSIWLWLGIGCGVIVLLIIIVLVVLFFVLKKAVDDPIATTAKLALMNNPHVEFVSADKDKGEIKVRDKKTGKIVTISYEDAKNGRFSIKDDSGEGFSINTDGKGGVAVEGKDGETTIGNTASALPNWIPAYPGAKQTANWEIKTKEKNSGVVTFETADKPQTILAFYKDKMEESGFETNYSTLQDGSKLICTVTSKHQDGRNSMITISGEKETTTISITYATKE